MPWNKVILEHLTGPHLVKQLPAFYGNWRFITAFTIARDLSLTWAKAIQSMPHPTIWWYILILSSHLRLVFPSDFCRSGFPHRNPLCNSPLPRACYITYIYHFSWVLQPNNAWWVVLLMKLLAMDSSPFPCYLPRLGRNMFLSTLFSNILNLCFSLSGQVSNPYKNNRKKRSFVLLLLLHLCWLYNRHLCS